MMQQLDTFAMHFLRSTYAEPPVRRTGHMKHVCGAQSGPCARLTAVYGARSVAHARPGGHVAAASGTSRALEV